MIPPRRTCKVDNFINRNVRKPLDGEHERQVEEFSENLKLDMVFGDLLNNCLNYSESKTQVKKKKKKLH